MAHFHNPQQPQQPQQHQQSQQRTTSLTQLVSSLMGVFQPTSQNDIVTGREHEIMLLTQFFSSALTNSYIDIYRDLLRTNTVESQRKNRVIRQEVQRITHAPVQQIPITPSQLKIDPSIQSPEFLRQEAQDFYPHGQAIYLMGTPGIGKTLLTKFVSSQLGLDNSIPNLDPISHSQQYIFLNANYIINKGDILTEVLRKVREFDRQAGCPQYSNNLNGKMGNQLRQACCNQKFFFSRTSSPPSIGYQYYLYQQSHLNGIVQPIGIDDEKGTNTANEGEGKPIPFLLAPLPYQHIPYQYDPIQGKSTTSLTLDGKQVNLDDNRIKAREETRERMGEKARSLSTIDFLRSRSYRNFGPEHYLNTDSVLTFDHLIHKYDPIEEQSQLFELSEYADMLHKGLPVDACEDEENDSDGNVKDDSDSEHVRTTRTTTINTPKEFMITLPKFKAPPFQAKVEQFSETEEESNESEESDGKRSQSPPPPPPPTTTTTTRRTTRRTNNTPLPPPAKLPTTRLTRQQAQKALQSEESEEQSEESEEEDKKSEENEESEEQEENIQPVKRVGRPRINPIVTPTPTTTKTVLPEQNLHQQQLITNPKDWESIPTIDSTIPRSTKINPHVSVTQADIARFDSYTSSYLPQTPVSSHFGIRYSHTASIILVIDEFDQLPEQQAAELIRTCYSPFSRLFLIGLGNKLNFMDSVMNDSTKQDEESDKSGAIDAKQNNSDENDDGKTQSGKSKRGLSKKKQEELVQQQVIDQNFKQSALESIAAFTPHPFLTKFPTKPEEVKFTFPINPKQYMVELRPSIVPFKQYDFKGFSQVLSQRNLLATKRIVDWALLHYHHNSHLINPTNINNPLSSSLPHSYRKRPLDRRGSGADEDEFTHRRPVNSALVMSSPPRPSRDHDDHSPVRRSGYSTAVSAAKQQLMGRGTGSQLSTSGGKHQQYSQQDHSQQNANALVQLYSSQDPIIFVPQVPDIKLPDINPYVSIAQGESFSVRFVEMRKAVSSYTKLISQVAAYLAQPEAVTYCARTVSVLSSDVRSCLEIWKGKLDLIGFFNIPNSSSNQTTLLNNTPVKSSQNQSSQTAINANSTRSNNHNHGTSLSPTRSFISRHQQGQVTGQQYQNQPPFSLHQLIRPPQGSSTQMTSSSGSIHMRGFMRSHGVGELSAGTTTSSSNNQSRVGFDLKGLIKPAATIPSTTLVSPTKAFTTAHISTNAGRFNGNSMISSPTMNKSPIPSFGAFSSTLGTSTKQPRYPIIDLIYYIYQQLGFSEEICDAIIKTIIASTTASMTTTFGMAKPQAIQFKPTPLTEPFATLKASSILQGKSVETLLIEKTNDKLSKLNPLQLRVLSALVLITLSLGNAGVIELTQFSQLCDVALDKVHLPSVFDKHETLLNTLNSLEIQHLVGLTYTNSQKKRVVLGTSGKGKSQSSTPITSYKYSQTFSIKCLIDPVQFSAFLKLDYEKTNSQLYQRTIAKIDKLCKARIVQQGEEGGF